MKLEVSAEVVRKLRPQEFYKHFLPQGIRPDGRNLLKVRKTIISAGSLSTADGSALVKMGSTSAICGIKAEVTIPSEDAPKSGKLVLSIELPPLCSPNIQHWTDSVEPSASLEQQIETILLRTKVLDLEQLCIEESEAVWVLYVDAYILEHNGNVFDTTLMAILTALTNVRLPKVEINDEHLVSVIDTDDFTALELNHYPIPLSFCVLDGFLLVDPTSEEESLASTSISIVYNNREELCSVYKSGGSVIDGTMLEQCQELTKKRNDQVVRLIQQASMAKKVM